MLRDRLVCGIANKGIQRRLLQDPALTFKEAMKVAQSAETADKDAQRLTARPNVVDKDLLTTLWNLSPLLFTEWVNNRSTEWEETAEFSHRREGLLPVWG